MTESIDKLPLEMLVKIFSYLSLEDLVLNAQYVCERWKIASHDKLLWKYTTFKPCHLQSQPYIINILKHAPMLRHFIISRQVNLTLTIKTLCKFCPNIKRLDIYRDQEIDGKLLFKLLEELKNLDSLYLSIINTKSCRELSQIVSLAHNLKSLSLSWIDIPYQDDLLMPIADGCHSLQHLNIGYLASITEICNRDMIYLLKRKKHQLVSLSVHFSDLTIEFRDLLNECEKLEKFELSSVSTEVDMTLLGKLSKLKRLSLTNFSPTHTSALNFFRGNSWDNLVELKLDCCTFVDTYILNIIFKQCKILALLNLTYCHYLTDIGLLNIFELSELKTLIISGCCFTSKVLHYILKCDKLENLHINQAQWLTDKDFGVLVTSKNSIRSLFIEICPRITGSTFPLVPVYFKRLSIVNCLAVKKKYGNTLQSRLPHLQFRNSAFVN